MKVRIVYWCSYVPDCPADLEVTSDTILGIFPDDEDAGEKIKSAQEQYKADCIRGDYEGALRYIAHMKEKGKPVDEDAIIQVYEKEKEEAIEDFDEHYDGFFMDNTYEFNTTIRQYVFEDEVQAAS